MSSGMGMVEKVARAIDPEAFADYAKPLRETGAGTRYGFWIRMGLAREQARAAIEAMREPTEAMVWTANRLNHPRDRDVWITMIDAALQDGENVKADQS